MKKYTIILSVIFITIASCQKNATDVKLPPAKVQLVIQSFISPQDSITRVYVTESTPVFGKVQQYNSGTIHSLPNATVQITHNSNIYNLVLDGNGEAYIIDTSQLKIVAGETYSIKVTRGSESVTASCTVPLPLPFDLNLDKMELQAELDPHTKDTLRTYYRLATSFTDVNTPADYYRVYINSNSKSWDYTYDNQGNIIDSNLIDNSNLAYFENSDEEFISDIDYNNMKVLQNSTLYLDNFGRGNIISTQVTFGILHVDVNYYKYHTSANAHLNNQGNPFAEPSLIFTNIQGGLGIFAAYNYRYWTKKL